MLSQDAVQALAKLGHGDRAAKFAGGGHSGSASPSVAGSTAIGPNGHRIKFENGRWVDLIRTDSGTVPTSVSESSRLRVGKGRTVEMVGPLRCV